MTPETEAALVTAKSNRDRALDGLDRAWAEYRAALHDRFALPSAATGTAEERLRALVAIQEAQARCNLCADDLTAAMQRLSRAQNEASAAAWSAIVEDFGA